MKSVKNSYKMFNNIPPVTKNLLILNILFFLATLVLGSKGIDLTVILGTHYMGTASFEPYQIITYMFMHSPSNFMHILFNMLLLVMFGSHLERIWGAKRYFIFYIASGLGAFFLYNGVAFIQIMELKRLIVADGYDLTVLDHQITSGALETIQLHSARSQQIVQEYVNYTQSTMLGASGAVFGLLAGFAVLFPNTELMLLFPPIPIKAKYLIGGYIAFEVYNSFSQPGDSVAHLAHVGGAIVGIVLVLIWRKKDRQNFY